MAVGFRYNRVMKVFTDAGTANNGKFGYQKTIIVITDEFGKVLHEEWIGDKTNNEGETLAIYWVLKNIKDPEIFTDSKIALNWSTRAVSKGDRLRKPVRIVELRDLVFKEYKGTPITWIGRDFNLAGHYIENKFGL